MIRISLLVFTAMCLIVTGDTAGKVMTQGGVAPSFIAWSRFAIAAAVLLPFSGLRWAELRSLLDWRVLLRAGLIAAGISCILTALRTEPIANVFGAFFIGPVVAYILSVLLLGEQVSKVRSILLALGFAGVMLVVRPGFGAGPGMAMALLAGCFYGGYLVATRWLAGEFRPRFLLISQLIVGAVVLMPMGVVALPVEVDPRLVGLIGLSALASAAGNYLLVTVSRTTPATAIVPLVYTQLIAATLAGVMVFGIWPDPLALIGLGVILLSGLASLWLSR
ncbi:Threonine/homoserine efflux transporter RhtA [Monaibacterium marinum]|uniref:Threonine/homoserine efflux transporter RhtA n=1 Tax=Pontivivens marinum TaxID=1690039 RepID=A0A2C9CW28_9RHOB|nr:DMT family transporter [Monaibacterium marinum]SOH95423.1 Threonine/homoserine efflux transporter RhtA [Monaibacterium marinum]